MNPENGNKNENEKIPLLNKQIDDVKKIMMMNIDKVLDRGERLDHLSNKTESLRTNARYFQKQGSTMRREFRFKQLKICAIIAFVLIVLIMVIVGFIKLVS